MQVYNNKKIQRGKSDTVEANGLPMSKTSTGPPPLLTIILHVLDTHPVPPVSLLNTGDANLPESMQRLGLCWCETNKE